MRIGTASIVCSFLVAGCSPAPTHEITLETKDGPDPALIANLEMKLSQDRCLADIAKMRREYRYGMRDGKEIRDLVDIKVLEAGVDGLPSGIFIKGNSNFGHFDSRPYFVAFATYHQRKDELNLWACGNNADGARSIRSEPRF